MYALSRLRKESLPSPHYEEVAYLYVDQHAYCCMLTPCGRRHATTILFDQSKREEFTIFSGLRALNRHLQSAWNVEINNDEIADSVLAQCRIFVIPYPKTKFYAEELDAIQKFVRAGGSLLVLMSEEGERRADTNINLLLEEYGIACKPDSVIRTTFYKYFDPKEALIANGVTNRAIRQMNAATANGQPAESSSSLTFVYPYGSTLSVNRNATVVLSTGTVCSPLSQPICAFHEIANNGGRVAVVGSVHMFVDDYLDKEDNMKIFNVILTYLSEGLELNRLDAANPELTDPWTAPDYIQLSSQLKMCLQESDVEHVNFGGVGIAGDFTRLFDATLCSIHLNCWSNAIRYYKQLNIPHEPLSLVAPVFEVPLPSLQPAVFMPNLRENPPPQLELFDLNEAFSSQEVRLVQLTNRCKRMEHIHSTDDELDLYVREAGELLGIGRLLAHRHADARSILSHVIRQIIEYKKSNQDDELPPVYAELCSSYDADDQHYFSYIDEYDDNLNR